MPGENIQEKINDLKKRIQYLGSVFDVPEMELKIKDLEILSWKKRFLGRSG